MVLLRSTLFLCAFFSLTVVLAIPLSTLGWVMPYRWLAGIRGFWAASTLNLLRLICGLGYRVRGLEHLGSGGGVILCKHQSAWETIALSTLLPQRQTWLLKRELLRIPFFGWGLAPFRPIAIDRSSPRQAIRQLLEQGGDWLRQGYWVVVYPEGTRVAPGQRRKYNPGGAMLAERAGSRVVPIAHNAGIFWARRDVRKYPGTIDVVIGPPIEAASGRRRLSAAEINRRAEEWIETEVAALPQHRERARIEPGGGTVADDQRL